ncbi:MAG TPA: DUF5686 and carboxypeptidase regulatory-like domain-containing protein [Bacteroidia bacterium]|nr:DUF5686 and carboxypeptidase regulatory-like domain-containing protein [Bacteroidia bacterium]
MRIIKPLLISIIVLLGAWRSYGANLTGKITDESGQPLPFVVVYIDGTTNGTTANVDGEYSIELKPGTYTIDYQLIGYTLHRETVEMASANITRNVQLKAEGIKINEVTVNGNAEDPAYGIMRHAIEKRKFYQDQVEAYSCDVYIKGLQRITKHPKKIFGREIHFNELDSTSGIIYLSESVSKFNFKQPDKIREEMISSKVSGNSQAFSYNQASDMLIDFYKNNIQIDVLSERGLVSPIASDAMFFYKYHLAGSFVENGKIIDKIEVIPKRQFDPVFRGYIYIQEDTWRIHSTDMYLIKDAQINFLDTIFISQSYLPVTPDVWMLFSNKYKFVFNILGIKGNGVYVSINKNYAINPDFPKNFFNGEILKIDDNANKKDTAYWNQTRPVPLTKEENKDYVRRDSIHAKHETKEYLDSVDARRNKFKISTLYLGYRYFNRFRKQSFFVGPIIQTVGFNTVQGLNGGLRIGYNKEYEDYKRLSINASGGYGFSDERWYGDVNATYACNPAKLAYIKLGGGLTPVQFNEENPITPFLNTVFTLLQDQNYMKLYQKANVHASYVTELVNGLLFTAETEYADRSPLMNTTNYKLVRIPNREYTSNNPQYPQNDSTTFTNNRSWTVSAQLKISFKQQYYTLPHQKFIDESKYPILILDYKKAIGGTPGLDANYDFGKATLSGKFNLKLLGKTQYSVSAGKFFSQKDVYFMDYYHFAGDQILFSSFGLNSFHLLDYYKYSTTQPFVEAHLEHHFEGFIFNKIPLLRKLKLDEVIGADYMHTSTMPEFGELFVGLQKFRAFRIDYAVSFAQNARLGQGIRIGIGF